jgi:uncharacterized protein YdeI (YjbR/CyaY-like superfamily)
MGVRTLYVHRVSDWRAWLRTHHRTAREIWLVYYRKASGKPRISHRDAVDEALCFGWIDSTARPLDADRWAQRFTPRRKGSPTSELNKARARRLVREKRMTRAGLDAIGSLRVARIVIADDVRPRSGAIRARRLRHLVKRSAKNERFGMIGE